TTHGLLAPPRLPSPPTRPGRTRWSTGTHGHAATVIDDLDTASIQIAEDLAQACACYLRSTHAADPATDPRATPRRPPGRAQNPPGRAQSPPDPWDAPGPPPY